MDTLTSSSPTLRQPVCDMSDGLETLYEPSDCIIVADVIFVHGLGGHPQETWTYKGLVESGGLVTEPEASSFRKLFKRKKDMAEEPKKVDTSQSSVYWPKDLLPKDIRNVRILTYGYSQYARPYTRHTINQAKEHGYLLRQDLLMEALCTKRKTYADRPLIFVAHSFGGTLVKEALVEFYRFGRYAIVQGLTELCQAVMFFGTPHKVTSNESWDLIIRNIIEAAKPESKSAILKDVDFRSSFERNKLRANFNALIEGERIKVCNFQEGQGTAGLKHFGGKAVPDGFSRLSDPSLEASYTINANHMNMCRFRDSNDPGYQMFIRALVNAYPEIKLRFQETVTSEEA